MHLRIGKVSVAILALCKPACSLKATILADTNHDGIINAKDEDKGAEAIFIANIGDTNQRCSKEITSETPDDALDQCHDASDNEQRNPKYLAPIRTLPCKGANIGTITVVETTAAEKVRIFVKTGNSWMFVNENHTFTAQELENGLALGIDARDVRRPQVWDGRATIRFTVANNASEASDEVKFRVAPVLTHHHGQNIVRILTSDDGSSPQGQFISELKLKNSEAGISESVYQFERDIWTQDFFEPAYTSFPGPDGPITLRVMIRSSQVRRVSGRQVFTDLRSDTVGAVQFLGNGTTLDSTGNLETIPPYTHNGKSYPAGRIIMGHYESEGPLIMPFLQAQEIQHPLKLDTEWLLVSHVDEFVQFLPTDSSRGWVMMIADPLSGLDIFQKAIDQGYGDTRSVSRPWFPYDGDACVRNFTISQELQRPNLVAMNQAAARRIEKNIEILKKETGIEDEEIFRVPSIFYGLPESPICSNESVSITTEKKLSQLKSAGHDQILERRQQYKDQVLAYSPGVINGVPIGESLYLAPNPWGPIVNGRDIVAEAVTAVYAKAKYNVTYMDDWHSHHTGGGEIHCGSNTFRDTSTHWW